ncbi:MAG: 4Fe-4S binding protein [Phycisphaera sp.]|nr:4Fe-4S binding protein [Phycisphaera sp.]
MSTAPPAARRARLNSLCLRAYRMGVVIAIALMVYALHAEMRIQGDRPIDVQEVQQFLPKAFALELDDSPRQGVHVLDVDGNRIGYALKTMPECRRIIGYSGPSDTLVVLDPADKVLGIRVRSSADTNEHVQVVSHNDYFLRSFNGMDWKKVASIRDLWDVPIEGVSGATLTSTAVAQGVVYRFRHADEKEAAMPAMQVRLRDVGLTLVIVTALLMAFTHLRGRTWMRRTFQVVVIGYVGFINGDLLAQSLIHGWAASGVAWRQAPGLVLLLATAVLVPWTTRRQVYCSHICPHGAAQELLGRVFKRKFSVPRPLHRALRWLPGLLLGLCVIVTMLGASYGLAGIEWVNLAAVEPFDAYVVSAAGWATITIAIVGLVASLFVPQAYCKYGCPTGQLLEFVRSHGAPQWGRRDTAGLVLLAVVTVIYTQYGVIHVWLVG